MYKKIVLSPVVSPLKLIINANNVEQSGAQMRGIHTADLFLLPFFKLWSLW